MIRGIGIDIVHIERIERAIKRYGELFLNRVFTKSEKEYCSGKTRSLESYAARFAVKEAAFKALGRGWSECGGFKSVEVYEDEHNRPFIKFHNMAERLSKESNVKNVYISISHDAGISAAVVIFEV